MLGAVACSTQLPSETPLGLGPLARRPRPPDPSGAPVSLPGGGGPQMQFEDDDEDSTAENERPPSSTGDDDKDDVPDAGITTMADAGGAAASAPATNAPAAALDFTGDYSGKDVSTFRISGIGDQKEEDPNAKLSVKKSGDSLTIVVVASNTGDPLCTLKAEQKGDTATLAPGQECTEPQSPFARGKLTRGQAKLQGKQITLDMSFEVKIDAGGKQLTGGIEYHFEGTKR
jgi:hypothetical protein